MNPEEYYMARLEKTACILSLLALASFFFFPVAGPALLGSIAVVFAVLSKGGNLKFSRRARIAFLLGMGAIVFNVLYMWAAFRTLRETLADPAGRQQLNDIIYRQYGITLDELLQQLPDQPFLK